MVTVGETVKDPDEEEPRYRPPVAESHHDRVNPPEFPLRSELVPHDILEGFAPIDVGSVGDVTVTVTEALSGLLQEVAVHEIVTWPLPVLPKDPE